MNAAPDLTIVSFSGPSGSGKTTALRILAAQYSVLPERYMELNRYKLDNRLALSKWAYNHYWFDAVLDAHAEGTKTVLTDRCPLDTCAYVRKGQNALLELVTTALGELAYLNIAIRKILVTASFEHLQARIHRRLQSSPERLPYHEADEAHNRRAYDFYSEHSTLWDKIIDTSTISQHDTPEVFRAAVAELTGRTG